MALNINISISVEDDQAYTTREAAILAAMQAHPSNGSTIVLDAPAAAATPAATKAGKPAAGRRVPDPDAGDVILAKAKADLAAKQAAEAAAEEEANVVAEQAVAAAAAVVAAAEEDLVGGGEPTMQDAVDKATAAISAGKQAEVKAALASVGAKRVSELHGANIAGFLTALAG